MLFRSQDDLSGHDKICISVFSMHEADINYPGMLMAKAQVVLNTASDQHAVPNIQIQGIFCQIR